MLYNSTTLWQIFVAKILFGFGIGLMEAPILTYVAEISLGQTNTILQSPNQRTIYMNSMNYHLQSAIDSWSADWTVESSKYSWCIYDSAVGQFNGLAKCGVDLCHCARCDPHSHLLCKLQSSRSSPNWLLAATDSFVLTSIYRCPRHHFGCCRKIVRPRPFKPCNGYAAGSPRKRCNLNSMPCRSLSLHRICARIVVKRKPIARIRRQRSEWKRMNWCANGIWNRLLCCWCYSSSWISPAFMPFVRIWCKFWQSMGYQSARIGPPLQWAWPACALPSHAFALSVWLASGNCFCYRWPQHVRQSLL